VSTQVVAGDVADYRNVATKNLERLMSGHHPEGPAIRMLGAEFPVTKEILTGAGVQEVTRVRILLPGHNPMLKQKPSSTRTGGKNRACYCFRVRSDA